jgi:transposase-like protein
MGEQKGKRVHGPEFRVRIAERMMAGENLSAIAAEFDLPRSMMYRWRDAYRQEGARRGP